MLFEKLQGELVGPLNVPLRQQALALLQVVAQRRQLVNLGFQKWS